MSKDENNRVTSLRSYGIDYSIVPYNNEDDLIKAGYNKLPKEALANADMLLQYVPAQVANEMINHGAGKALEGAYKVVLKDGLHLGKSNAVKGAYKGLVFNSSNNLTGQADLIPLGGDVLSAAPQIALGVFNAMSIVTGQYFMSQINGKLVSMEANISNVLNYLEDDKRSGILADDITLKEVYQKLSFIMSNDLERQTTSEELKRIRNKSLKNILFFKAQVARKKKTTDPNNKKIKADEKITELLKDFPEYWCSVSNYMLSTLLDTIITGMDDEEYVNSLKEKIRQYYIDYQNDFEKCNEMVADIISNAKELNKKKILPRNLGDYIKYIPTNSGAGFVLKVGVELIDGLDTSRELKADAMKSTAHQKQKDFIAACRTYTPFDNMLCIMDDYRDLHNRPLEMVYTPDAAFIKHEQSIQK